MSFQPKQPQPLKPNIKGRCLLNLEFLILGYESGSFSYSIARKNQLNSVPTNDQKLSPRSLIWDQWLGFLINGCFRLGVRRVLVRHWPSPEPPPRVRLCRAQRGTRWRCCPCISRGASLCRPCAATASGQASPYRPPLPAPRARHYSPGRRGDPRGPEWCTCGDNQSAWCKNIIKDTGTGLHIHTRFNLRVE